MYAYLKSFFKPKENLAFEEKPSIYSKTKSFFSQTINVIFNKINSLAQFMFRKISESISFIKNKFSNLFKRNSKPEQKNNFDSTKFNTTKIVEEPNDSKIALSQKDLVKDPAPNLAVSLYYDLLKYKDSLTKFNAIPATKNLEATESLPSPNNKTICIPFG